MFFRGTLLQSNRRSGAAAFAGMTAGMACTLLAACGPDFQKPAAPDVTRFTPEPLAHDLAGSGKAGGPQHFVEGLDIPGQWWETFHSRALNDLIEDSLKHNADLQAAQAALRVAHETAEAQKGAFYPQVSGNYNGFRQKVAGEVSPPGVTPSDFFSLHTFEVDVSYAPDVFGLVQKQVESAEAQSGAQRFQLEATYLTLTSNVVLAAIQEASLRSQIASTEKIIAIESDLLKLLQTQKGLGQVATADVLVQEAALAQSQQTLPPLQKQLAQQRDLLTALAGRFPSDEVAEKFTLDSLRLPRDLPVSLPSKTVEHRPDVQAAEANMHSASAAIGVAIANRLPVINLTANGGTSASAFSQIFQPPTYAWTVAGSVSETIFDGFSLYHKQRAAEAAYEQADAQYRSTVITAFQNVADTLRALQADARGLQAAVKAEDAALKSLDIVRKQAQLGQVNSLAILNAQQTYLQSLLTRAQAQANRYSDTAALFQALGGGWWNRTDVIASTAPCRSPLFTLPTDPCF